MPLTFQLTILISCLVNYNLLEIFYIKRSGGPTLARILVTASGGTVSSSVSDGLVKLESRSPVLSYLARLDDGFEFIPPANYSSENARPEDYRDVLKAISEACEKSLPDGIIILHGTDTMAYFAQIAVRVLSRFAIPFVITGSKIPPDSEGTDAFKNIDFAVGQVKEGRSGVVFTTHEGVPAIVPADKVTSPDIYGDYGVWPDSADIDFSGERYKRAAEAFLASETLHRIQVIPAAPTPGILDEGFDTVLITCHHSGTADIKLVPKVRKWRAKGIRCFMAPVPRNSNIYESRAMLEAAGATALPGMPPEGAWAEALIT
jgi:L-asparaginase/Glu-tRNA(Gln) amidotransferase subunit D